MTMRPWARQVASSRETRRRLPSLVKADAGTLGGPRENPLTARESVEEYVLAGLAVLAADGDVNATEKLFQALLPRVRNLARYLVKGDQDVDDLAQEALVAVYRGLSSYRGEGPFRAWADRVAARCVFRALEERRAHRNQLSEVDPDTVLSDEGASRGYLWRRTLVACLDRLSWEQRQAIVLHFVVGMTVPEVADEVGVALETTRSRLRLGMGKLKALFADDLESRAG